MGRGVTPPSKHQNTKLNFYFSIHKLCWGGEFVKDLFARSMCVFHSSKGVVGLVGIEPTTSWVMPGAPPLSFSPTKHEEQGFERGAGFEPATSGISIPALYHWVTPRTSEIERNASTIRSNSFGATAPILQIAMLQLWTELVNPPGLANPQQSLWIFLGHVVVLRLYVVWFPNFLTGIETLVLLSWSDYSPYT